MQTNGTNPVLSYKGYVSAPDAPGIRIGSFAPAPNNQFCIGGACIDENKLRRLSKLVDTDNDNKIKIGKWGIDTSVESATDASGNHFKINFNNDDMTKISGNSNFWQKNGVWTNALTGQPILNNKRYQLKANVDGNHCLDGGSNGQTCAETGWRYFQLQNEQNV